MSRDFLDYYLKVGRRVEKTSYERPMHKTDYNSHYRADYRLNKLERTHIRSRHYVAVDISSVKATQGSLFTRKHRPEGLSSTRSKDKHAKPIGILVISAHQHYGTVAHDPRAVPDATSQAE